MLANLDDPAAWGRGAVVMFEDETGAAMVRPAAFLFARPGGAIAWVEPSYADPAGAASPALHERPAEALKIAPYDPAEDQDLVGDALDWFAGYLRASGRTWAEERARVAAVAGL